MSKELLSGKWPIFSLLYSDLAITLIILVFSCFWGGRFIASGAIQPRFDQGLYAPAVMEACAKGFVVPTMPADKLVQYEKAGLIAQQSAEIPGLQEFLEQKQTSFDCNQIPSQIKHGAPIAYQKAERYLMGAVALIWRLAGVSWNVLIPLHALLFGLSGVAAYGVFRLGMGKPLAVAFTVLLILSSLQLNYLPHLRDYSKGPFIIATVLLLGWMVKYPLKPGKTVLLSSMTGALLGLGFGFRTDLLVFVPAVLITLALFTPSGYKRDVSTRFLAVSAFMIAFLLLGWPILSMFGKGGAMFHVILLGLMQPFDENLGIRPSDVYEWGYLYHDWYVKAFLDSFSQRILKVNFDRPHLILVNAPKEYAQTSTLYYFELLRNFPADIATRVLAAVLRVLQMPFDLAPLLVFVGLVIISNYNMRLGLFAAIAVIYLCGYPSLQFGVRHYFHLQFVSLFFFGVLCQVIFDRAYVVFSDFRKNRVLAVDGWLNEIYLCDYKRGILSISAILLVIVASIFFLQRFQQGHLQVMMQPYAHLSAASNKFATQAVGASVVRLLTPEVQSWPESRNNLIERDYLLRTDYWILELDGRPCDKNTLSISIRYNSDTPRKDYSRADIKEPVRYLGQHEYAPPRSVVLDIKEPVRYIFHTYSLSPSFFAGLDIDRNGLGCVKGFGRVVGFEKLPLLMNLTFRKGWENERLYQSIELYRDETIVQ